MSWRHKIIMSWRQKIIKRKGDNKKGSNGVGVRRKVIGDV
jgi:SRSO17 transposase